MSKRQKTRKSLCNTARMFVGCAYDIVECWPVSNKELRLVRYRLEKSIAAIDAALTTPETP